MIIRCERCSTLYKLDDALLAPEGSPVQCTRCQAVFSARPPRPAQEAAPAAPPAAPAAPVPAPGLAPGAAPAAASGEAAAPAAPPRPVRTGPAIYRPPAAATGQSTAPGRHGAGAGRHGPMGTVEQRARRANLGRRLAVPAAVAVVVALVLGGAALWRRRPDPEVQRLAAEATALLAQDDAGSLARAVQLHDALLARARTHPDATAARALARILLAAAQQEEAEPFAEQLAARTAERERLKAEQPPGVEDSLRLVAVEASRLEGEVVPRRKAAGALLAQAASELKALASGPGGPASAARGQALLAVLAGEREETARLAAVARSAGEDPWADLAEAWSELRTTEGREAGQVALSRLASSHPELLRARWLLARSLASVGRREEATATLAGLLAANPRHERAQRLRASLAAAAPAGPAVAAPAAPPPPRPQPPWTRPATEGPGGVPAPVPGAPALAAPGAPLIPVPVEGGAPDGAPTPAPAVPEPPAEAPVEAPAPTPPPEPPPPPPRPKPREPEPIDPRYEPG